MNWQLLVQCYGFSMVCKQLFAAVFAHVVVVGDVIVADGGVVGDAVAADDIVILESRMKKLAVVDIESVVVESRTIELALVAIEAVERMKSLLRVVLAERRTSPLALELKTFAEVAVVVADERMMTD